MTQITSLPSHYGRLIKPVIRGRMIQLATKFKRERKITFSKLETNFNNCHQTFQSCQTAINNSKLEKARLDLDLFFD